MEQEHGTLNGSSLINSLWKGSAGHTNGALCKLWPLYLDFLLCGG